MLQAPIQMFPPLIKHDALPFSALKSNFIFYASKQFSFVKIMARHTFCGFTLFEKSQKEREMMWTQGL